MKKLFQFRNLCLLLAVILVAAVTIMPVEQAIAATDPSGNPIIPPEQTDPSSGLGEREAEAWTDMPPVYYSLDRNEEGELVGDIIIDHDGFLQNGGLDIIMSPSMMTHFYNRMDNLEDLAAKPGDLYVDYPYFGIELNLDPQLRRFTMKVEDFAEVYELVQPEKLTMRMHFADVEINADTLKALAALSGEEFTIEVKQTEGEPEVKFLLDGKEVSL